MVITVSEQAQCFKTCCNSVSRFLFWFVG